MTKKLFDNSRDNINQDGINPSESFLKVTNIRFLPKDRFEGPLLIEFKFNESYRDLPEKNAILNDWIEYENNLEFPNFDIKDNLTILFHETENGVKMLFGKILIEQKRLSSGSYKEKLYTSIDTSKIVGEINFDLEVLYSLYERINEHIKKNKEEIKKLETEIEENEYNLKVLKDMYRDEDVPAQAEVAKGTQAEFAEAIDRTVMTRFGNKMGGWRGIIKVLVFTVVLISLLAVNKSDFASVFI